MDPPDLARLVILQQELRIQIKQLELYVLTPYFLCIDHSVGTF